MLIKKCLRDLCGYVDNLVRVGSVTNRLCLCTDCLETVTAIDIKTHKVFMEWFCGGFVACEVVMW